MKSRINWSWYCGFTPMDIPFGVTLRTIKPPSALLKAEIGSQMSCGSLSMLTVLYSNWSVSSLFFDKFLLLFAMGNFNMIFIITKLDLEKVSLK